MQILPLIRFLLKPKPGRIRAINSPFEQEEFKEYIAQSWVRRNKATIEDGVLIFKDEFSTSIQRQFQREEDSNREVKQFESMIDQTQSRGRLKPGAKESLVKWVGMKSGRTYPTGPSSTRTMQLIRRWAPGSYKEIDEK